MDAAVVEKAKRRTVQLRLMEEPKKMSFEEAVAECNGTSVEDFFDELKRRVKDRYRNAKS